MKNSTKCWVIGGGLFLLMLPAVLVGVIAQIVTKYVLCGWELMGIAFDELEEWVDK